MGSDIQFSNKPGVVDFNNAWNNEIIQGNTNFTIRYGFEPYYYMPYYANGWFQIPRLYLALGPENFEADVDEPLRGGIISDSRYCNCVDGNCSIVEGVGYPSQPLP